MAFLKDPVANRPSIRWNEQLPDLKMTELLNLGGDTTRVDLSGGQVVSVELPPWAYVINSEVNLHAKSSWGHSLYGLRGLSADRHAEMYITTGLEPYEALSPGTGDFTVETLIGGLNPDTNDGGWLFSIQARNGTSIVGRIFLEMGTTTANDLWVKLGLVDGAGTSVTSETVVVGNWDPTGIHHMCVTMKRPGAGQPLGLVFRVDGAVLYDGDLSDLDNGVAPVLGANPATNLRITLGSTPSGTPDFIGDTYWVRYYKRALSAAQVQARALVAQSSNSRVYDAAIADMAFELTFQDQANWADPAQPESSDLTALDPALPQIVFNDGSLDAGDVQLAPGGQAATDSSAPIKAGVPTPVIVSGKYLSLLSLPGEAGAVWITPV